MESTRQDLLELLAKAEDLASRLGENGGCSDNDLIVKSQNITHKLLGPADWARDVFHSTYLLPSLRTASDAGWLKIIEESGPGGASPATIATTCGGDTTLIRQLLRFLAAKGLIHEVAFDSFAGTPLTSLVSQDDGMTNMLKHASQAYSHSAAQMPDFFASNGFRSPPSIEYTPYAYAHGQPLWKKLADDKAHGDAFNKAMAAAGLQATSWTEIYPIATLAVPDDQVMLVDVGGGRGHVLATLAAKQPGKLILQDKPEVVADVPSEWRDLFEILAYDFFTPQPVLNARAYYMRFILHDWPDDRCVEILQQVKAAMKPGWSTLLINELVLPDVGCPPSGAGYDMVMMTVCAAQERTESEWNALLARVGQLRIQKIWKLQENGESVIEVVREDGE